MRSCDIQNLQFESVYNEELREHIVKDGSEVLVCPKCGYQHKQKEKAYMIENGGYIHKVPERLKIHPSYQVGALASQLKALSWSVIAQAQLAAGKRSDIQSQMLFDNSFRGLPYHRRIVVKEDFEKLKQHCWNLASEPSLQNIEMVFLVADTQQNRSVIGIFGFDVNDNLYLIDAAEPEYLALDQGKRQIINQNRQHPVRTVEDYLNTQYLKRDGVGIKPMIALIDRQGHRSDQIQHFSENHPNVFMYQGTSMTAENFRPSQNVKKLFLVSEKKYRSDLIYYLYSQKNRSENYLFLKPQIQDEVIKQIVCVKPDATKKFGDDPANWQPQAGAVHDYFDVCKMAYVTKDIALRYLSYERFRFGKAPSILRRFGKLLEQRENLHQVRREKKDSFLNSDRIKNWMQ